MMKIQIRQWQHRKWKVDSTWEVELMDLVTAWVRQAMETKILPLCKWVYSDSFKRDFGRWGSRWMLTFESRSEASRITSILYSIHVYHKVRSIFFIERGKWARSQLIGHIIDIFLKVFISLSLDSLKMFE